MNQKNVEYIKTGLRELGFGDKLYPDLETTLAQGKPRVSFLHRTAIDGNPLASSIHLEKSAQSDKYRITKYDTMIRKEPDYYENDVQTFYINKNKGVTLKEAYNLLDGRSVFKESVNKEGKTEQNWLALSFKQQDRAGNYLIKKYGESDGFDLRKTVSELPILEMKTAQGKEILLRSLEKGNLEMVTVAKGGSQEKIFLEANPSAKTVNLYDKNLRKIHKEELVAGQGAELQKQGIKKEISQNLLQHPGKEQAENKLHKNKSNKRGLSH